MRVRRNEYGRQIDSFESPLRIPRLGPTPYPGVFIRAPKIVAVGPQAEPLAFRGAEVVGVRQGRIWGLAFHPELSGDPRLHAAWIASIRPDHRPKAHTRKLPTIRTPTRPATQ